MGRVVSRARAGADADRRVGRRACGGRRHRRRAGCSRATATTSTSSAGPRSRSSSTAGAVLVAAEEGILELDEPAGPPGATVRHLLAHASGLPVRGRGPARSRSRASGGSTRTRAYETLGRLVEERAEMAVRRSTWRPPCSSRSALGATELRGSPASECHGPLADVSRFGRELLSPDLRRRRDPRGGDDRPVPRPRGRAPRDRPIRRRSTGGSAPSCAMARRRTGRARGTRRGRSATSAARGRSSGSTRRRGSPAHASPTGTSTPGRSRPGPPSRTPCWPSSVREERAGRTPRTSRGRSSRPSRA